MLCVIKNEDEINDFVELTKDKNINVRFIEYMPFDDNEWNQNKNGFIFEMKDIIQVKFEKLSRKKDHKTETC